MTCPEKWDTMKSPEKWDKMESSQKWDITNSPEKWDNMKSLEKTNDTRSYYSDILIHLDGTVNQRDLGEDIPVYHTNIVLLLTGVAREELEEGPDDKNILSSNLVLELGRVTKTEIISDESGYDSEDDIRPNRKQSQLSPFLPAEGAEYRKATPSNRCFNRPPSGYRKNVRKPQYRSFSSTPSPRTLPKSIQSWQHNFMTCPVCTANKFPALASEEFFC